MVVIMITHKYHMIKENLQIELNIYIIILRRFVINFLTPIFDAFVLSLFSVCVNVVLVTFYFFVKDSKKIKTEINEKKEQL